MALELSPETDVRTMQLLRAVWEKIETPAPVGKSPDVRLQSLHYAEALAKHLGLIPGNGPGMADVTLTVGTTGRDYSTWTAAEADLDNGGLFSASDNAILEGYDDAAFESDEAITWNGGSTIGLASIRITVASAERHDGTAGSGARILHSTDGGWDLSSSVPITLEWLEFDFNGNGDNNFINVTTDAVDAVHHLLLHGGDRAANMTAINAPFDCDIHNNVLYDFACTSTGTLEGIDTDPSGTGDTVRVFNNTLDNFTADDTATGIAYRDVAATAVKNNVATNIGDACFSNDSPANADTATNMSSDATSPDGASYRSITAANQYVSTTGGSEDYHIQDTDADIFEAGTDRGTTPTGVNIDADGFDRNAGATTWSIGAFDGNELRGGATTAIAGTASLNLSAAADLSGPARMGGSAVIGFSAASDLYGMARMVASGQISFAAAADIIGRAELGGGAALNLSAAADIVGRAELSGDAALGYQLGGRLRSPVPLSGNSTLDFIAAGVLSRQSPPVDTPGLEFTLPANRLQHTLNENRMHHALPDNRLHFTLPDQD